MGETGESMGGEGADPVADGTPQSKRFLYLYALAWSGGSVSYIPFLTVLLPGHLSSTVGAEALDWLAYVALTGAIVASVSGIVFGWLSDLTRRRTGWIVAGMTLSSGMLLVAGQQTALLPLLVAIVFWQIGLNMMLAPLAALAGDTVPDRQKGTLGGLLAFAPAFGALSGVVATLPGISGYDARLSVVAVSVACMVLPVVLIGKPVAQPALAKDPMHGADRGAGRATSSMWWARLLLQIAEAALFAFLFLWLKSLNDATAEADTARLLVIVFLIAIPLAMVAGRWADARGRPIRPLVIAAAVAATGLVSMSLATSYAHAVASYLLFSVSAAVFLSLHTAQTLRVLPRPSRRGRDLGIFNLTNTLPSFIMPLLALLVVPRSGFAGLFALLAVIVLAACLILSRIRPLER